PTTILISRRPLTARVTHCFYRISRCFNILPVHILPSRRHITITDYNSVIQQYKPTANDTTSLAESTLTHSDVSSSPQSIAENTAKRVKLIIPQVKATPSELHSAAPEVIDVDVDENNTAPAAEQDDEADLETLKKTSLETACLRHQPVHSSVLAHGSVVICSHPRTLLIL
ncbi:hypothetical protein EDB19DRAFT_2045378, partial [Suillus lakei]